MGWSKYAEDNYEIIDERLQRRDCYQSTVYDATQMITFLSAELASMEPKNTITVEEYIKKFAH